MCSTCNNRKCHVQVTGISLIDLTNYALRGLLQECCIIKPLHIIKKKEESFALVHFETEVDAATFYYVYRTQDKVLCPRLNSLTINPSLINNQPVTYNTFQIQSRIISSSRYLCRCSAATMNQSTDATGTIDDNETSTTTINQSTDTTDTIDDNETATTTMNQSTDTTDTIDDNETATTTINQSTDTTDTIDDNETATTTMNQSTDTTDTIDDNETATTTMNQTDWRVDIEEAKKKIRVIIKRKAEEIQSLQKRLKLLENL
ncbi:unnamed protein product [Mucor fragilis]